MDGTFDYTAVGIGDNIAEELREVALRIRGRTTKHAIETGRDLIAIKPKVGHDHFVRWVDRECDFDIRTAENYMSAARWVDSKSENVSLLEMLPLSVIYALAADGVPPDVEGLVVADFLEGNRQTAEEVRRRIAQAKKEDAEADAMAEDFLEDLRAVETSRRKRRRAVAAVLAGLGADDRAAIIAEASAAEPASDPDEDTGPGEQEQQAAQ